MKRCLRFLATSAALLGAVSFVRPRARGGEALLWLPKLLAGALVPVSGLSGALAALAGAARRDWVSAGIGALAVGLAAKLAGDIPDVDRALAALPERAGPSDGPERKGAAAPPRPRVWRDLAIGRSAAGGELRADLWPPAGGAPSGIGIVYAHGSAWRVGDKDKGTRTFFRRLSAQGHLVLDVAYTLWPRATLPQMVAEVNRAVLWLKEHGTEYGARADRVVLMGGSAGGHLVLLAAYAPDQPAFRPEGVSGDTSVRGVVAFYPPVDLAAMQGESGGDSSRQLDRVSRAVAEQLFAIRDEAGRRRVSADILAEMLGGSPAEVPDTYRLLSPSAYAGAGSPPTLLLQGTDDVFGMAPDVRRMHESLCAAGVPAVLLEFPHTEHAFDIILPAISPVSRASTRAVERFLAWLR